MYMYKYMYEYAMNYLASGSKLTPSHLPIHSLPLQVAAYDFSLPVLVNGLHPPSPPPSPWPPSLTHSKVTVSSLHHPHTSTPSLETTPTRRVLATGLRAPLLVSTTRLHFSLEAGQLETLSGPLKHDKVTAWNLFQRKLMIKPKSTNKDAIGKAISRGIEWCKFQLRIYM